MRYCSLPRPRRPGRRARGARCARRGVGLSRRLGREYVEFDLERAVEALERLDSVERFLEVAAAIEAEES
jgi:hypothetical protein